MTPAEVLAVMDAAIDEADSVSVMPLTKARAAVAALVAELDALRESITELLDCMALVGWEDDAIAVKARAALSGAGHE